MQTSKISSIYLIKPTSIRDYGIYYSRDKKPQLGVYIAYTNKRAEKIRDMLETRGYIGIRIDEIRFESLRCLPLIFSQQLKIL